MNEHYLYLALTIGSVLFPLLFSFYPKANFSKEWKHLFPALLITALVFIVWDEWFTQMNIWGFNPRYITGIYLGSLPLEEVLFFILIPYACLFIYFAVSYLSKKNYFAPFQSTITRFLMALSLIVGMANYDRWYTSVTFISLAILLGLHHWYWKSKYLATFYFTYLFVLIPFFLVNGILTGSFIEQEVVWYNNNENLNVRIGTIPVDDLFYNMLMLLMVTTIYEWLKNRKVGTVEAASSKYFNKKGS